MAAADQLPFIDPVAFDEDGLEDDDEDDNEEDLESEDDIIELNNFKDELLVRFPNISSVGIYLYINPDTLELRMSDDNQSMIYYNDFINLVQL